MNDSETWIKILLHQQTQSRNSMAFWDEFEDVGSSLITKLKEDNSITLETVVGDVNCLMLLRDENETIVDFFSKPEIFRQMFRSALSTSADPTMDEVEQYRLAHQCSEVLSCQTTKLYKAYTSDDETIEFLAKFLETNKDSMNHLVASFFAKILLALYNYDHVKILAKLSETKFLETAMQLLKFSAISELLFNLTTCIPPESREDIKKYYIDHDLGRSLLNAFKNSDDDFLTLENVVYVWSEFIRNTRDICYTFDLSNDNFLLHLQNPELLGELLTYMFPDDKEKRDYGVIASGCSLLRTLADRTFDMNHPLMDMNKTEGPIKTFNPDPEYESETLCAKYIAQLLEISLDAARDEDGDVMSRCLLVVEEIMNTSQSRNHAEFVHQLKQGNFGQFFDFVKANPTISILNNSLYNIVSYMLHCTLSEEDHLVTYVIDELGITSIIVDALKDIPETGTSINLIGIRSFFYRIAERIAVAKEQSQNSTRIMKRISELSDDDAWAEFSDTKLKEYLREHLPADMSSTRNHSMSDLSNNLNIAVDEIMDIGPNEFDTSNKSDAARSPTSQLIEGLQKLNDPQNVKNFFEQTLHADSSSHHQEDDNEKSDDEEDIFDIIAGRGNKNADKMDVDDWPTTSGTKDNDDEDDELELFKKLKPIGDSNSKPNVLDEDWPVTTLPPPMPNEDVWDTFTSPPADDFPKEKNDS